MRGRKTRLSAFEKIVRLQSNWFRSRALSFLIALPALLSGAEVRAQVCEAAWDDDFGFDVHLPAVGMPGPDGAVFDSVVFDDGTGPALYACGSFDEAGGALAIDVARWDGAAWSALGAGLNGAAHAMAVFDDGGGDALYVAGGFTAAGIIQATRIAKWDGAAWSALGEGLNNKVDALVVFDDGSGPALYAGGHFKIAGTEKAYYVARWDGESWSPLGEGLDDKVSAMAVCDVGDGSALYVAGEFSQAGQVTARHIAKWDGAEWSSLNTGTNERVEALAVFDDGDGDALYAGGRFIAAGAAVANHVAKWDGVSWSPLGDGCAGDVFALESYDDGTGTALIVGGSFTQAGGVSARTVARWNGEEWAPLGDGLNSSPIDFTPFDAGDGMALYACGAFRAVDNGPIGRLTRWDGTRWFEAQGRGVDDTVNSLHIVHLEDGPALVATGLFDRVGLGHNAKGVALFDGEQWDPLAGGIDNFGTIHAVEVFDSGAGPALYVAGAFESIGGKIVRNIARWDGAAWNALATGVNQPVNAMAVYDDGTGPALYVACDFNDAGGVVVNRIARWDGATWTPLGQLGGGLGGSEVNALAVYEFGSQSYLVVGGDFESAGGQLIPYLALWDGEEWASIDGGPNGEVTHLDVIDCGFGPELWLRGEFNMIDGQPCSRLTKWDGENWETCNGGPSFGQILDFQCFDDGDGLALFAGGTFSGIGGVATGPLARWDGVSWTGVGQIGIDRDVYSLAVFDDGRGPALFIGGTFNEAEGLAAKNIVRWDGAEWSVLGLGLRRFTTANAVAMDMEVLETADSSGLYVGGDFDFSGTPLASNFARWNACPPCAAADLNCDGDIGAVDLAILLSLWGENVDADLDGDGVVNALDLAMLLSEWGA